MKKDMKETKNKRFPQHITLNLKVRYIEFGRNHSLSICNQITYGC